MSPYIEAFLAGIASFWIGWFTRIACERMMQRRATK
jgi:hypothetical protein